MNDLELDVLLGKVVIVDENDYMYGMGPLRLRLERITLLRSEPGWALVAGLMVDFRGDHHQSREVMVRIGALSACAARL